MTPCDEVRTPKGRTPKTARKNHLPNFDQYNTPANRKLVRSLIGVDHEVIPWYRQYYGHYDRTRSMGVPTTLTFRQYVEKLHEAHITEVDQIGRKDGQYQLKRDPGVTGPHTVKNCRFIKVGRRFRVFAPSGEVFEGTNATAFAHAHSLLPSSFRAVLNGQAVSLKGWTGSYIEDLQ